MRKIDELIEKYIGNKTFPGGVLLIGNDKEIIFEKAYGYRALFPEKEENSVDTIYDLASLTKVIATTPAIMKLLEDGEIRLWDSVGKFLKEFSYGEKQEIKIFHLLTHTSGLPSYSNAWKYAKNPEELKEEILKTALLYKTGEDFLYSCLNFIILRYIIEEITHVPFDKYVKENVFNPLNMRDTGFLPKNKRRIAPTCEREEKILRGEPDDELAYYQGGISGNAGLFSTAEDLYRYARSLINKEYMIFSPYTLELFTREHISFRDEKRGLGWMIKSISSSCGDLFSEKSFGHTGYTGTSLWIDPLKKLIVIFLSNRTHISRKVIYLPDRNITPSEENNLEQMIEFRPRLHNLIVGTFFRR
ncbi:MAG: beta-lactamase family protein [Dictyoglomaceae bacterium]|nr:beta-lactamase family protein [Dictyoglomaceae bacterium]